MPELAEVMIMSEYINSSVKNKTFINYRQSNETKVKKLKLPDYINNGFKINATSRGKSLILHLQSNSNTIDDGIKISISMGMTGNWDFVPSNQIPKHSHLMFDTSDGYTLCLIDARRFAKWKLGEDKKRGPCPVKEHKQFRDKILKDIDKNNKLFEKPIYEVLMDQKYFNGIGNYLRAEILYRAKINPFIPATEIIKTCPQILDLCKEIPEEAYVIGGGKLKDWENPYNRGYGRGRINKKMKKNIPTNFVDWLQCYQKETSIIDKKGRRFWFDKKYLNFVK